METIQLNHDQAGCWLSNSRGHYISRDVIDLAVGWGWIIGPFEQYAVSMYDNSVDPQGSEVDYPHEALIELCDEAIAWLNSGQVDCDKCDGKGIPPEGVEFYTHKDRPNERRCRACSGTGRGDRIEGQNFPPIVPDDFTWAFEDGDFGLWRYDDDGNVTE